MSSKVHTLTAICCGQKDYKKVGPQRFLKYLEIVKMYRGNYRSHWFCFAMHGEQSSSVLLIDDLWFVLWLPISPLNVAQNKTMVSLE